MTDHRALSFDSKTIDSLPAPIAYALAELSNESSGKALLTLWHTCDAVELMLRLIVTMLLSDLVARNGVGCLAQALEDFNFRRPTLGQWKQLFKQLIASLPSDSAIFEELAKLAKDGLFDQLFDGKGHLDNEPQYSRQFTGLRNRLAHGSPGTPLRSCSAAGAQELRIFGRMFLCASTRTYVFEILETQNLELHTEAHIHTKNRPENRPINSSDSSELMVASFSNLAIRHGQVDSECPGHVQLARTKGASIRS